MFKMFYNVYSFEAIVCSLLPPDKFFIAKSVATVLGNGFLSITCFYNHSN